MFRSYDPTRSSHRPVYMGNFVAAPVPLDELQGLLDDPAVVAIENTEHVRFLPPLHISHEVEPPSAQARSMALREPIELNNGVLIGIIDVQGFDFAHAEFLDGEGRTRFVEIWDQGGNTRPAPKPFGYGSVIAAKDMNAAIVVAGDIGLPATELEPRSLRWFRPLTGPMWRASPRGIGESARRRTSLAY